MALLYSLLDATAQDDPEYGHVEAGPDGGFDFPDDLSDRLHGACYRGRKAWETQGERRNRLHGEDLARRRDPAALYDAVGEFTAAMKAANPGAVSADLVAALSAQVEALTARLAELEGPPAASDGDGDPEPAGTAKTSRPRSKATPAAG